MDREEREVEQLNDDVLKAYLADHVAEHGHLPSAGVMPLQNYLRGECLVAPEPARRLAPLDRFLDEYRGWLAVERALSPGTVCGYTRLLTGSSWNESRPRTSWGWSASRALT